MTFKNLLDLMRAGVAAVAFGVVGLMLGPFQGLEHSIGLNDLQAHAISFYALTLLVYLVAPHRRRSDLSVVLFGVGILIELAQGATGRAMGLADVSANGLGIVAAYAPGLVEQMRRHVRRHPRQSIATFGRLDRRRRNPVGAVSFPAAPARSRLASERALGQGDGRYGGRHDSHVDPHRPSA